MAQTGYTPIKLYASSTALAVPSAGNLDNTNGAELAININDGKLYYKDSLGAVQIIGYKNVPISTLSGAGTGVLSALAVNIGTAGAFVVNGGALGTPSSGTVTNLTGTASININGTVGATTPAAGTFTDLTANGNTILGNASTDTVTVNGYMGVGGAGNSSYGVQVTSTALTGLGQVGVFSSPTITSASTTGGYGYYAKVSTAAASFTVADIFGVRVVDATKGAGSIITNQHGLYINDQTQGTNNYGILSLVSSGTNKWNIYASGTAPNYFAGNVGIGTTTPVQALEVIGAGAAFRSNKAVNTSSNTRLYGGAYTGNLATIAVLNGDNGSNTLFIGGGTGGGEPSTTLSFITGTAGATGTGTERMRIDSSGNVGIGTSSPASLLHINANNAEMRLSESGTYYGSIKVDSAGGLTIGADPSNVAASSRLIFSVDGTERLRIDSAGNLGLGVTPSAWGTTNSLRALELLNGAVATFSTTSMLYSQNAYYNGTNWIYKTTAPAALYSQTSGAHQWSYVASGTAGNAITFTQAMTLDASGRLLVGTTASRTNPVSSASFLQIENTSSSASPAFIRNTADAIATYVVLGKSRGTTVGSFTAVVSGDQVGGVMFTGADGTSLVEAARIQAFVDGTPGTNDMPGRLVFSTTADGASSPTERMRIDSSGNVGIGTSSPVAQLQLGGGLSGSNATYVGRLQLNETPTALQSTGGLEFKTSAFGSGYGWKISSIDSSGVQLVFGTRQNSATWTEMMRIDSSGNVGIGTSSVSGNLQVAATNPRVRITNTSGTQQDLLLGADSGVVWLGNEDNGPMYFVTNNTERARIDSSGNLLIGQTTLSATTVGVGVNPAGLLNIAQNNSTSGGTGIQIYSTAASAYRFYVNMAGTIFATSTTISAISDQRFKENVRDLDSGLSEIMSLRPRLFDWKDGKGANTKNARGFIAQEFEQVFPDLIDEWKDPAPEGEVPYKSVRQDLIPVLVKAIQELKAELDATKAEVAALKGA